MKVGANYFGNGICELVVWAPFVNKLELKIGLAREEVIPMQKDKSGYWKAVMKDFPHGLLYAYRLDEKKERADPASHFQPQGVHGLSQVVDHSSFIWEDRGWGGIELTRMIIYELHVGTFTPAATFGAIIPRLGDLKDLGVNAIELMPVAQFPGERNWGYDGVYPYAVQNSYGGPDALKELVNACHRIGMAVILDVVYNHLGPEGNYFMDFGPYFTDKYKTPWGKAINFDDAYGDFVRDFFIENAVHWFVNYHIDALRLDAIHAIYDASARPFLQQLAEEVEECAKREGRKLLLIAESNSNDARVIKPREQGGYGIDALWCDDFHHSLHTLITGESQGYYIDFGRTEQFAKSLREGFVYSGEYSQYRKRNHGISSKDRPAEQFVVFSQNHDQIGNRILGERLSALVSFEALKLAAGAVLLSPYIPLLFMGEEYGEDAPFLYCVSQSDSNLIEAIRRGRKEEFKAFNWQAEPPDPLSLETFDQSKLKWEKRTEGRHRVLLDFYRKLLRLRRETPALANLDKDSLEVRAFEQDKIVVMRRWKDDSRVLCLFSFNCEDVKLVAAIHKGIWKKVLDSSDRDWNGPGSLLPETIYPDEEITIRGWSLAIYSMAKH